MLSNRSIASIHNQESAAFASLLLVLCTQLQVLKFRMTKKGRTPPRCTTPWLFGLTYVWNSTLDGDVDVYDDFQETFLPSFLDMSGVTSLNVVGGNLEILDMGFKNLTTLDVDIVQRRDGHYINVCPTAGPVGKVPALQNLIIRCDWQALEPQPDNLVEEDSDSDESQTGQDVTAIKDTFLDIEFPQLASLTIIVERSPRPARAHTGNIGKFDALIEQLTPIAGTLEELTIRIGPAFDKVFLNYLKPVTTSLTAFSNLRKLTFLWQALAAPEYLTGSY